MKTMPVTDFKAHALKVLGEVAETRESVLVTKRGKPLAEIVPFAGNARHRAGWRRLWFLKMILWRLSAKLSGTSAGEVRAGYACVDLVADEPEEAVPSRPHPSQ